MSDNPWVVDNLKDFWFMNCPECVYKTKTEDSFQDHAFENHPSSFVLFDTYAKSVTTEQDSIGPESDKIEQNDTNFSLNYEGNSKIEDQPKSDKTLEELMFYSPPASPQNITNFNSPDADMIEIDE